MLIVYNLGIRLYGLSIRLAALFSDKAKKWVEGRRNWRHTVRAAVKEREDGFCLWMHCASLGEFEQGRPIIEGLREKHPDIFIVLTFFSPSGYEIRKNYPKADLITYLPLDTAQNARDFIAIVKPQAAIFVKYEFWHHFIRQLSLNDIPAYLISAVFRKNQLFFKPYGGFFRRILKRFDRIFVQNESSYKLVESLGITKVVASGDTRIDRVLAISQEEKDLPILDAFCETDQQKKILVVGSSWPPDEAILLPFIKEQLPKLSAAKAEDWKVIIAPHDISEKHVEQIMQPLGSLAIRYSEAKKETVADYQVLVIDNIGMLAFLYRYGQLAYIGGGFGVAIHNTLEAIVYGLPVFFGTKFTKFQEAVHLAEHGGAFVIEEAEDFKLYFEQLQDEQAYKAAADTARQYILNNQGASQQIITFLSDRHLA
ncbi:MAG: 3-deoxy-D-manno-octulosonic acid transferase [Saprospiraceae bacterium]|nr:3-deoxy-D-manno-octulosonic acid transferase [Saprospiraceae bacterium]